MSVFQNDPLIAAFIAWFLAQFAKILIHLFKTKEFNLEKLFASGGMPSSHSSTVCALTVSIGIQEGMNSTLFALSAIFSVIIMYDATGVRLAVSKHAKLLNDFFHGRIKDYKNLNELVGHTGIEVLVGALLGILVALFYMM